MAEGINMVWGGLNEMRHKFDELIVKADLAAKQAVTDGGHLIERRAKQKAPVLTGTLRRSIHVDSVTKLGVGRWQSITGPSVIYAKMRELGTSYLPDGVLKPVNASILSWVGPDGMRVFARSVKQVGHPYMRPAFDESIDAIHEIYRLSFEKAWEM